MVSGDADTSAWAACLLPRYPRAPKYEVPLPTAEGGPVEARVPCATCAVQ
jgi:hypothetical protein